MSFSRYKKTFACLGIALILLPSVFLAYPRKAEAVVPVIDVALNASFNTWAAAWGAWAGTDVAFKGLQMPAWTFGSPYSLYENIFAVRMKEVGLTTPGGFPLAVVSGGLPTSWDGIAYFIAKLVLHALSRSVVTWIRSGFQGGPGFITDLQYHLADAADQATGAFMKQFLSPEVYNTICSPFRLQLRIALQTFQFRSRYSQRMRCTLSSVLANAQDAVQWGQRIAQGDWGDFITVTSNPQNNPVGALMISIDSLYAMQSAGVSRAGTASIFNAGFLGMKECEEYYADEFTDGNTCIRWKTTSPGKWVSDQLSEATGVNFQELNMADELNEIVSALLNLLLSQLMGGILR